jgi:outer membrane protein TolC
MFSLLRDREIDDRRFGTVDARLALQAADLDVLLTRIGVQQQAISAYWRWVTAGHQLQVYRALLELAERREEGLAQQVQRGARARIFLTENRQNITRRRSLTTAARRDFRKAANQLAYYYRDRTGRPVIPEAGRLPETQQISAEVAPLALEDRPHAELIRRRPELQQLLNALDRARNRIELHENDLQPRLDLSLEVGEPFGDLGEGGPSRDTTETIVGLTLSVPLQQRQARGALQQSRALAQALRQEQRALADQLELQMHNLLLDLQISRELVVLAALEVEQAEQLMRAEVRRFDSGASDFFLVNVREETAADARIRFLRADLAMRLARADYDAATVNLERLGLQTER